MVSDTASSVDASSSSPVAGEGDVHGTGISDRMEDWNNNPGRWPALHLCAKLGHTPLKDDQKIMTSGALGWSPLIKAASRLEGEPGTTLNFLQNLEPADLETAQVDCVHFHTGRENFEGIFIPEGKTLKECLKSNERGRVLEWFKQIALCHESYIVHSDMKTEFAPIECLFKNLDILDWMSDVFSATYHW